MATDLEEIKRRLNVVDVLGEYLRLEKAGANYRALCPFHNEKSPSFMVSEERQTWHCFGCQKGGDIFSFVMEIEGLEFREALKLLADKAGVKLENAAPGTGEKKARTLEILELATKFYEVQLWKGAGKGAILDYLKDRGLTEETIRKFRLGYAPKGWRNVLTFLVKRGYGIEEIIRTGLLVQKESAPIRNSETESNLRNGSNIRSFVDSDKFVDSNRVYDRFRERIIFPICDYSGRVLGYSARVAPGGDESQAKYVNSPETEVYHKSSALYGIDKARTDIKRQDAVLLVEGNMDVIAASQAGLTNVVAISGTALTPQQLDILKRYTKNLLMLFDMDAAGQAATKKSLKLAMEKDLSVRIVELPFGKDAADVAQKDPERLRQAVIGAKDALEYLYAKTLAAHDRDSAKGKKAISEEMLELIASLASEVEKSHWLKKLAQGLDVTEPALTDALKKIKLPSRTSVSKETQAGGNASNGNRQKVDLLLEELAGLMLASPDIWRELAMKQEYHPYFFRDGLLRSMIERGAGFVFDAERFCAALDREISVQAQNLLMRKKFRIGLNNEPEEILSEELLRESEEVYAELKRQVRIIAQAQVEKDLRLAKERGDKTAEKLLLQELNRIISL